VNGGFTGIPILRKIKQIHLSGHKFQHVQLERDYGTLSYAPFRKRKNWGESGLG
jgi:hypothetical protein